MLANEVVREIERLLCERGLSQRAIARKMHVSRGSVERIATGQRRGRADSPARSHGDPSGPYVRCPQCGGKVQMPCLACRVRESRTARLSL